MQQLQNYYSCWKAHSDWILCLLHRRGPRIDTVIKRTEPMCLGKAVIVPEGVKPMLLHYCKLFVIRWEWAVDSNFAYVSAGCHCPLTFSNSGRSPLLFMYHYNLGTTEAKTRRQDTDKIQGLSVNLGICPNPGPGHPTISFASYPSPMDSNLHFFFFVT